MRARDIASALPSILNHSSVFFANRMKYEVHSIGRNLRPLMLPANLVGSKVWIFRNKALKR